MRKKRIVLYSVSHIVLICWQSHLKTFKCGPNQNIREKSAYKSLLGNTLGETTNKI